MDPYPPDGGAALRNWQNICAAQEIGDVGVIAVGLEEPQDASTPPEISLYRSFGRRSRQNTVPGPLIRRAVQVLHPFRHHRTDRAYAAEAAEGLSRAIKQFGPDVVVFEEVWLYRYFRETEEAIPTTVLDAHNVEAALRPTIEKGRMSKRLVRTAEGWSLRRIEESFVERADQVWFCSEEDQQLARNLYGEISSSRVIPNGINTEYYQGVREQRESKGPQSEAPTITFIGGYGYQPNQNAAHFLIDRVWPKVRGRIPACRLVLVGGSPSSHMRDRANQEAQLDVPGRVPDVRPFLAETDVVVTPLFEGGGTRLKILEAFAVRCPVVSTPKGVEGLDVQDGRQVLLGETAEELARESTRLLRKRDLRDQLTQNAWECVRDRYDWPVVGEKVRDALQDVSLQMEKSTGEASASS
jgi:glycosyltransferase involved in cell wall biosynthesis